LSEIYRQWHRDDPIAAGNFDANKQPKAFAPRVEEMLPLLAAPNYIPTEALDMMAFRQSESKVTIDGLDALTLQHCLRGLAKKARVAGEHDAEADYAIALMRFAAMQRRGTTINTLNGGGNGTELLAECRNRASLAKAKEVVEILEQTLHERENLDVLLTRTHVQQMRQRGWQGRLEAIMRRIAGRSEVPQQARAPYLRSELALHSIQILYAIRLFQEEHGRLPRELAELPPEFLTRVPLDPYSQQPLAYRPEVDSYKLYSVGPNGIDDGGQRDDFDLRFASYQ
jgi:hypothetical protein